MIEEYNKAVNELKNEFIKKIQPKFIEILDEFDIEGYRWTQYTPYFNDGDTCTFGVNYPEILYRGEFQDYFRRYRDGERYYESDEEARLDSVLYYLEGFLQSIDANVMNTIFGDHAQITVTKEGIAVENYHHE